MPPLEQLIDSFAEVISDLPIDAATSTIRQFLDETFSQKFQDLDLVSFCQFLLDHMQSPNNLSGLAVVTALREMNDHLSLNAGQYLDPEEIQARLIDFNLLHQVNETQLLTSEGHTHAEVFFGNSSYLLVAGVLLTEIDGQKFSAFKVSNVTEELLFSGVFLFESGRLPVINSKIQTHFSAVKIDDFHGDVINNKCYGIAKSGKSYYIVHNNIILEKLDLRVTDCLGLSLNEDGSMRAIIQTVEPITDRQKICFIDDNKLQEFCGDTDISDLSNLYIDNQGNLTGLVSNPLLPGNRTVIRLADDGSTFKSEEPHLLPFTNGLLLDTVDGKRVDYQIHSGFYDGKSYGKFMIEGKERFILKDHILVKIDGTPIVDIILDDDFPDHGRGIIVLEDDSCILLNKGMIVKEVAGQEIYDSRSISTANDYPLPSGFFFDGVNWLLALNGKSQECPISKPGFTANFSVEGYDYLAEVGPNGKLNYSGKVELTNNDNLAEQILQPTLILNGKELTEVEFQERTVRFVSYSSISFDPLGGIFCEIEAEDGTLAYYVNGKILDPKDYYLLPSGCLAKSEIIDYLRNQKDFFEQFGEVEISDVKNYREGINNLRYFSFKYDGKSAIILGNLVVTESETIKDLDLDISEANAIYLGFTNKGTVESYGYQAC